MRPQWRKYLGVRAPRYTSYPSALRFDGQTTSADYRKRLSEVGLYEPLSLYIHIPFCRRMCWYCGCNMRVENDYSRALRYVEALNDEIALVGRALAGAGRPLSVHFGGGTPNYLKADDVAGILEAVELSLGLTDSTRLSIELDPRLIADGDIESLGSLGFSRMSLGVQDFDPAVQAAINRIQSFDLIDSAVGEMRRIGVDDISFDLLYGLPLQTLDTFEESLTKTVALAPDRVAVFGYAHLPAALPRQRLLDESLLPADELRADLADLADRMLVEAGYRRIGFDHYAKPDNPLARAEMDGRLRRNFQGFTDDPADTTLGFGASAISQVGGLYAQNAKSLADYYDCIRSFDLATARGLILSPREQTIGRIIREILCRSKVDIAPLMAALAPKEAAAVRGRLDALEADGVISTQGDTVALAPEARALARVVAMALDPDEKSGALEAGRAFARAV